MQGDARPLLVPTVVVPTTALATLLRSCMLVVATLARLMHIGVLLASATSVVAATWLRDRDTTTPFASFSPVAMATITRLHFSTTLAPMVVMLLRLWCGTRCCCRHSYNPCLRRR